MQRFTALARIEVTTRYHLLWLGALVGAVGLILELAAPLGGSRGLIGLSTALAVGYGTALLLGTTTLANNQASPAPAFLLAQPVSPATIWWSKLSGLGLLMMATQILAFLPTLLVRYTELRLSSALWVFSGATLALPLAVAATNFAVLAVRATWHSWLCVALIGVLAAQVLATLHMARLEEARATKVSLSVLALALASATLIGGWAWVAKGRLDRRAGSRALLAALVLCLAGSAAWSAGSAAWLARTPARLRDADLVVSVSRDGDLALVASRPDASGALGWLRDPEYHLYLWQLQADGASSRVVALPRQEYVADVGNGLAVWTARRPLASHSDWCLTAAGPAATREPLALQALLNGGICYPTRPSRPRLSPDLRHVAVTSRTRESTRLSVFDSASGKSVEVASLPGRAADGTPWTLECVEWEPHALRFCQLTPRVLYLRRIDLATGDIDELGQRTLPDALGAHHPIPLRPHVATSPQSDLLVVYSNDALELLDKNTASLVRSISPDGPIWWAKPYRDGVLYSVRGRLAFLSIADGHPEESWQADSVSIPLAEMAPGRLLVLLRSAGDHPSYAVIDTTSGEQLPPPSWLQTTDAPWLRPALSRPYPEPEFGSGPLGRQLLQVRTSTERYSRPMWVDLATGERTPLLP